MVRLNYTDSDSEKQLISVRYCLHAIKILSIFLVYLFLYSTWSHANVLHPLPTQPSYFGTQSLALIPWSRHKAVKYGVRNEAQAEWLSFGPLINIDIERRSVIWEGQLTLERYVPSSIVMRSEASRFAQATGGTLIFSLSRSPVGRVPNWLCQGNSRGKILLCIIAIADPNLLAHNFPQRLWQWQRIGGLFCADLGVSRRLFTISNI